MQLEIKRFARWLWGNDAITSCGRVPNRDLWMRFTCCPNLMFLASPWLEVRVYSKHFFRSITWQKYSILKKVLEFNLQKKKKKIANKSRFYCLYVKKKTSCVSLFIYILSRLTYKMKDEINRQIVFPQRFKTCSLTLYAV